MPMLMSLRYTVASPMMAELTTGCFRRVSATAFTMKARKVSLTPRSAYSFLRAARTWATRVKSISKRLFTCAETRRDMIM